jgi:acyl carrier protein phosphodiesterase
VKRYAFEMQLGAGLLEFIGEIAQRIYLSAMKSPVQLQDLVSDHQFEMWLSKFLEMEHIPHYLNQFLELAHLSNSFANILPLQP